MIDMPRAGVVPGRTASIQVATPDSGAAVADFGARMQAAGMQWQAQQREQQVRKAQLDITRDLGAARLEVEQIGDPTQIGPAWDEKVAEVRARHIPEGTDAETANALGMSMQGLSDKHGLALSEKVVGLGRANVEAGWVEARQAITTEAPTADPTTLAELIQLGEASIDDRVQKSMIDPAEAQKEKQALREDIFSSRAISAMDGDPAGFLAAAEAGDYNDLGPENLARYKVAAQKEIDRRAEQAIKAEGAAAKERSDALGKRLSAIADLTSEGRIVVDEALLNDAEAKAHPNWAKARAAASLRDEMPGLRQMTLADLDAVIVTEEKRPVSEPWENDRLDVLRGWRDKKAAALASDPVSAARTSGLPVPDLPEFDASAPGSFAAGLQRRFSFSDWAVESGQTGRAAIFDKTEQASLKAVLDPMAPIEGKVALAQAVVSGATDPRQQDAALTAMDADPVFRRATRIMGAGGNPELASDILRGQQKIAGKTVIMPSQRDQTRIFDEVTGGAFDASPALKAELMATAGALYADGAAGVDAEAQSGTGWLADKTAIKIYTAAIKRSLGATPDRNGNLTVGGLQEVRGAQVVLPSGVAVDEVNGMFENLDEQIDGGRWDAQVFGGEGAWSYDDPAYRMPEKQMRAFQTASVYGGVPDLGHMPARLLSHLKLQRIGETDYYEFRYSILGRTSTVPQADGRAYRFRLQDLMREAKR